MSVTFDVIAQPRETVGKGASRRLRREGLVPVIVYGGHQDPEMLSIPHNELLKHLEHEAFYSHMLNLHVGDEVATVVLKDLQRHPAKPFVLHVDFLRVMQNEKLRMTVPVHFLNEEICAGVKAGGQVLRAISELEISCFPRDLPEYIEVDVADLGIGDAIHLGNLVLPEGVELAHQPDPEEAVVMVHTVQEAPEEEEEETPAADTPAEGSDTPEA